MLCFIHHISVIFPLICDKQLIYFLLSDILDMASLKLSSAEPIHLNEPMEDEVSQAKLLNQTVESSGFYESNDSLKARYMGFYCVNTSYPMDNSLSGRRRPARQTSEKDVLCFHRPGRPSPVHSPGGV